MMKFLNIQTQKAEFLNFSHRNWENLPIDFLNYYGLIT